jgi:hypothetical protein
VAQHDHDVPGYVPEFYDPLGTTSVTAAICRELERQPLISLYSGIDRFEGSGLYAIYYRGESLPLYAPLRDHDIPLYAGQALSHNSRTGVAARSANPLWQRIRQHSRSIIEAALPIGEFAGRLLRLPDVHADLGENGLRVFYQPVWNVVLHGFGSHEQGASTRQSGRTKWDTVHRGRSRTSGADTHDSSVPEEQVEKHIAEQLARHAQAPGAIERAAPGTSARRRKDR